jgi:nucleotide-binding universal stress UspA family protein
MYKSILLPTDGSELANRAVAQGIALAKEIGARITAVTVVEPFAVFSVRPEQLEYTRTTYAEHVNEYAHEVLDTVAARAKEAGVACETVLVSHAHPYQGIIDTAQTHGCDLIMMASHGRRGVAAVVLGSETVKVLTHSGIPVLVFR